MIFLPLLRKKPKKKENETGCRRSMRLLKVDPSGFPFPAAPIHTVLEVDENVRKSTNTIY